MSWRASSAGPSEHDEHTLRLPCGHELAVPGDLPVIGLSGPILAHRDDCPGGFP